MPMPTVRFPVLCPVCEHESLIELPVATVAAGLMSGTLELRGRCDHEAWNANDIEREQIREYLGAPILEQKLGVRRGLPPVDGNSA